MGSLRQPVKINYEPALLGKSVTKFQDCYSSTQLLKILRDSIWTVGPRLSGQLGALQNDVWLWNLRITESFEIENISTGGYALYGFKIRGLTRSDVPWIFPINRGLKCCPNLLRLAGGHAPWAGGGGEWQMTRWLPGGNRLLEMCQRNVFTESETIRSMKGNPGVMATG